MIRVALVLVLASAACFEDRYRCTTDAQCDLGEGGRCEPTGYCTSYDPSCATNHRYVAHAAEMTDTCYDDSTELANVCAGGQGPATPTGCVASVCTRLPACCEIGWSDACAQVAQEECDVTCDTRIAITAVRNSTTELWDLRWDGAAWAITRNTALGAPLSWVAPAPGSVEPRLAGTTATSLVIGDTVIEVPAGRSYQSITSVSFDREQADTIAAGYTLQGGQNVVEVWRLDDSSVRETNVPGSQALAWGDQNRDGFPDAVVKNTNNVYSYLENLEGDEHSRLVSNPTSANVTGGTTPGAPPLRSLDWLDFDGDARLDLAVFGTSVRIHTTPEGLRDAAQHDLDCSPPSKAKPCDDDPEPDLEQFSFVGAALPTRDAPSIVFAQFPDRKLWRARLNSGAFEVSQLPFQNDTCRCIEMCNNAQCPGANCTCTYDCASCVPVLAIVSRDLDGDRVLDLVAIDARLRVYSALAASNFAWSGATQIPTTFSNTFFTVNASVSGAPLTP